MFLFIQNARCSSQEPDSLLTARGGARKQPGTTRQKLTDTAAVYTRASDTLTRLRESERKESSLINLISTASRGVQLDRRQTTTLPLPLFPPCSPPVMTMILIQITPHAPYTSFPFFSGLLCIPLKPKTVTVQRYVLTSPSVIFSRRLSILARFTYHWYSHLSLLFR